MTPGGTKIPVTESNKMDYLNELAQHRLGRRVSEEIREFLKGNTTEFMHYFAVCVLSSIISLLPSLLLQDSTS